MTIVVAAGARLSASLFNAFVPMYGVQGSDQSLTTTFADWNLGAVSMDPNQIWAFNCFFDYGNFSVATNDLQIFWTAPTGGATQSRLFVVGNAAGSGTVTDGNATAASRAQNSATVSFGGTTSTSVRGGVRVDFTVATGGSVGSVKPQFRMSAGTGTLYAGSYYVAHRLS